MQSEVEDCLLTGYLLIKSQNGYSLKQNLKKVSDETSHFSQNSHETRLSSGSARITFFKRYFTINTALAQYWKYFSFLSVCALLSVKWNFLFTFILQSFLSLFFFNI